MDRDDEEKRSGEEEIKVTDRRKFTSSGERIQPESEAPQEDPAGPDPAAADEPGGEEAREPSAGERFVTHVMALSQLGMIHLGEIENPATQKAETDLPGAREVIDVLGMLHEKTKGNLTPEEQNLLDTWLYQLRMLFSQKAAKR